MARLLLTSSQVQIIASCIVVVLCTSALFISGYVIQQRTLRELRVAIKPRNTRPSPKVYLPEKFRTRTKELEDGSVVDIDTEADIEVRRQRLLIEVKETLPGAKLESAEGNAALERNIELVKQLQSKVVEKMSTPEGHVEAPVKNHKPVSRAQRRKMIKNELQKLAQGDEPAYYQRRMW
ncbi:hypothetical protein LCI18_012392 [Fusarium solani-melongenae]|uniref:Uncharacterized protein n=1 Tax=Fusarium solani subsp. cucurbitae TaxID=2747967 RepID=A0ACD3ZKI7_FUSSC|nr:hypothetical protein LCI18_012392 [Fusarium solani-melongenae]